MPEGTYMSYYSQAHYIPKPSKMQSPLLTNKNTIALIHSLTLRIWTSQSILSTLPTGYPQNKLNYLSFPHDLT
jgi:hypothetical protein